MRRTLELAGTILVVVAARASAQSWQEIPYSVVHNFDFQPAGDVVDVRGHDFRHVWVQMTGHMPAWGVEAAAQLPDFDPFGTESWGTGPSGVPQAFNSGLYGSPVQCNYNSFPIPPTGINTGVCLNVHIPPSLATACTEFFVWPYGTTPPYRIQGSVGSNGMARAALAGRGGAVAYAYSAAAVSVRGGTQLASGYIQWNPTLLYDSVGGGSSAHAIRDPIHFVATNLDTGEVVEASLLDFDIQAEGNGNFRWDAGIFETNAAEFDFVLEIPPAFVRPGQSGRIELRIRAGIVDVSNDAGRFAGMLPPVGTPIPLAFPLPSTFDLDYDLNLDPTFPWDVNADLSGGGGANPSVGSTPCPADMTGDGILDFFDVLLYLDVFSGGGEDADFNNDGELNFFDVLNFLQAFSQGCPPDGDDGGPDA
ncbi:MAG: hypothetical protein DYG94_03035 [Leptolyngbya sp. PLA3]|nr:MAG: hypothetical protein EDM82_11265 [Cyanobacteria bacterium CYA]MCE7967704.1 hypothetical protein [Leptolyngbya sp. PL-A3]